MAEFGYHTQGANYFAPTVGTLFGSKYNLPADGTVSKIGIFIGKDSGADTHAVMGLYSSVAPYNLLGETAQFHITTTYQWIEIDLIAPVFCVAGDYIIALLSEVAAPCYGYYDVVAGSGVKKTGQTFPTLPDPANFDGPYTEKFSYYGVYTAGGGGNWVLRYQPYTYPHPLISDPIIGD